MRALLGLNIFILLLCSYQSLGQSSADERKRANMKSELNLSTDQSNQVDSVFMVFNQEFELLDQNLQSVQRDTSLTEEDLLLRMQVINQEKKDLKALRELELKNLLNKEQLVIYEEKIQPQKPQVLHFGIHNRADCNVCKE